MKINVKFDKERMSPHNTQNGMKVMCVKDSVYPESSPRKGEFQYIKGKLYTITKVTLKDINQNDPIGGSYFNIYDEHRLRRRIKFKRNFFFVKLKTK